MTTQNTQCKKAAPGDVATRSYHWSPDAGSGRHVRTQMPLAAGADSEPEPDVAVVDGSDFDYLDAHPATARLVVEVSGRFPATAASSSGSTRAAASPSTGLSPCRTLAWRSTGIRPATAIAPCSPSAPVRRSRRSPDPPRRSPWPTCCRSRPLCRPACPAPVATFLSQQHVADVRRGPGARAVRAARCGVGDRLPSCDRTMMVPECGHATHQGHGAQLPRGAALLA